MTKREIALTAWSFYRSTVAEFPEAANRATISACFRAAWENAAAPSARQLWEAMTGEEQYTALQKMAWVANKKAYGMGYNWAQWLTTHDDIRTAAAQAWTLVPVALSSDETAPLALVLYRAAAKAIRQIYNAEHAATCDSLDAEEAPEQTEAATMVATADPEQQAMARIALRESVAGDDVSAALLASVAHGYTVRESAQRVGLSKSAAQRRIDKIRSRLILEGLSA